MGAQKMGKAGKESMVGGGREKDGKRYSLLPPRVGADLYLSRARRDGEAQQHPDCCSWLTALPPARLTGALPPLAGAVAAVLRTILIKVSTEQRTMTLCPTHRSLICLAMVRKACSTLVAFLADVSSKLTPIWSANSFATA